MPTDDEFTRRDRHAVCGWLDRAAEALDALADELGAIGGDADKSACLIECASRDLRAAAWISRPSDHSRPPGWPRGF